MVDALALSEKALDLLVAGQVRLHGDIFGKMTELWLPAAYITAAKLACDQGQYAKALAYAKTSENVGSEIRPEGFVVEAQIWQALSRAPNTNAALTEAWERGSREGQEQLAALYRDAADKVPVSAPKAERKDSPAFRSKTPEGKEVDSAQLRGKIVVANFWFTGCGPCKAEIPDLNRLANKYQGKDAISLAFALDDDEAILRHFLDEYPFSCTIVPRASAILAKFGINTFPSHVVVDRDSKVEARLIGAGTNVEEALETIVTRLHAKPLENRTAASFA